MVPFSVSKFSQESNPYAPSATQSPVKDVSVTGAEETRNYHLSHEASVKSVGFLYLLGGLFGTLLGIGYVIGGVSIIANPPANGGEFGFILIPLGVFVLAISVVQFATGLGLRKLKPWTRIAGIVLSCIGLLGFPVGTLISAYILYLLLSKKGQFVFSDEYQQVMAATPHIKYKTSIIVWIFLGLLVVLILFGIVGLLISS